MAQTYFKGIEDEDVEAKLESEGWDYFFNEYIDIDSIIHPELKELVEKYKEADNDLHDFIVENIYEEY